MSKTMSIRIQLNRQLNLYVKSWHHTPALGSQDFSMSLLRTSLLPGRKRRSIQTVVQSKKAATIGERMSPNEKVCKDTARSWIALFTTPLCIRLECSSCRAPYLLS